MKPRSDGTMLVAIYHLVSGGVSLLGAGLAAGMPLLVGLLASRSEDPDAAAAIGVTVFVGIVAAGVLALITAANWVIAWGLWMQREWARLAAIVMAVLRLLNVPLGTIFGGLIIWHLLRPEVKEEFAT